MDKGIENKDITRPEKPKKARGKPGKKPHWASGAKTIVGTSVQPESRIWYTIDNGTLSEIYHPDVDQANTRSVRFVVTGEDKFFSDEMWDAEHKVTWLETGAPGCRIESRCKSGQYALTKEIVPDPMHDALLVRCSFRPANGKALKLYLLVDAHIGDRGENNEAWAGEYKGQPMVFASRASVCLAASSAPAPTKTSVGYIGVSDGFTVLKRGEPLPKTNFAPDGNVGMAMEIDYAANGGSFRIALACGEDGAEAGLQTRAGLLEDFDRTRELFVQQWRDRQATYREVADLSDSGHDMYRVSTAVLEAHQSKRYRGGFVAGLSVPWGFARGDKDIGGYHVLWPRDMVESAMGKLALGDAHCARSTLFYLACTQNADGGWSQNMWLDGTPHWGAIQMDAIALPILLADKLRRDDSLGHYQPGHIVHRAAQFLLRHGPVTQQDRWETTPGYSPNTMAAEVAALLAAADFADASGEEDRAAFLRDTADAWNDAIDELTYVEDTPLARKHGVRGYYMRMAPPNRIQAREIDHLRIRMPNIRGPKSRRAIDIISPGALSLVRMGLRAPDDPRIVDTVTLLDATLRREMKTGTGWKRSTDDGYGEKEDGQPFDKRGIGRCWPLLAGERGHFELAAGRREAALELLKTMARQTSECGMIPEQVWDADDIPERSLFNGHPSGSGMPLVWAHAEYIKLLRSLHEGAVWGRIPQTEERYLRQGRNANFQIWTPEQQRGWMSPGKDLRIDLPVPARLSWSSGSWSGEARTTDSGLGLHTVMLPAHELAPGAVLRVKLEVEDRSSDADLPGSLTVKVREK
ncbi:MAG TPA: glycoside hydrolase family 15 protein [Candidatus Aquilonibacter sp.]|nr:glycoside hydrolase family 15 protein [Candidatus Aquilonibacter sp.]